MTRFQKVYNGVERVIDTMIKTGASQVTLVAKNPPAYAGDAELDMI